MAPGCAARRTARPPRPHNLSDRWAFAAGGSPLGLEDADPDALPESREPRLRLVVVGVGLTIRAVLRARLQRNFEFVFQKVEDEVRRFFGGAFALHDFCWR